MPPKKRKRNEITRKDDIPADFENQLEKLAHRLRLPWNKGVKSRTIIYCDIGTRNLCFSMVRQNGPIPKASATPNWREWLLPTGKPVIELLLTYKVDLMSPGSSPHIERYERDGSIKQMRDSVDMTLAKPYIFTPEEEGTLYIDVPSIKSALLGKEWEVEDKHAGGNFMVWNERISQLVASHDMDVFFVEPYLLIIEPQCDQSKNGGKNKLVVARNHTVQHILMAAFWQKDMIRFNGVRRAIVLASIKYGTEECLPETKLANPAAAARAVDMNLDKEKRERAEYELRKAAAVVMGKKLQILLKLQKYAVFTAGLNKDDDAFESFTGALGYLENTQRDTPLRTNDIARCVAGVTPNDLPKKIQPPEPLTAYQKAKRSEMASDLDIALSRQFKGLEPLAKRRKLASDISSTAEDGENKKKRAPAKKKTTADPKKKKKKVRDYMDFDDDYFSDGDDFGDGDGFGDDGPSVKKGTQGGKAKVVKKVDFTSFDVYND